MSISSSCCHPHFYLRLRLLMLTKIRNLSKSLNLISQKLTPITQEENLELKQQKISCCEDYTWTDYMSLPFAQNVLSETLRLANIISLEESSQRCQNQRHMIPKGWCVLASFTSVHMDEENYENPYNFDPSIWETFHHIIYMNKLIVLVALWVIYLTIDVNRPIIVCNLVAVLTLMCLIFELCNYTWVYLNFEVRRFEFTCQDADSEGSIQVDNLVVI
ncbi:hypothetical protein K7X08_034137 [Anisodus acutangulus]|uniref:Uncharacterized protein n=1 Tax=Anisodus acutangulus TaxID=402998 RepID=A0A9Q1M6I3_9SOLA|nr:hypothetical protein K7X08_034137 [Anisodus acutangulus]